MLRLVWRQMLAFMVLGTEEAKRIVKDNPHLEACFIYQNKQGEREVWMSDRLRNVKC